MLVMPLTCFLVLFIFLLVFEISSHKWVDVLILIVFCHGGGVQILKLEVCIFLIIYA